MSMRTASARAGVARATGFVVAPGDVQALTEKVLMLARDKDLAQRMGQEGHRKALRQFDIRLTAQQVERVYDQVLNHQPRP